MICRTINISGLENKSALVQLVMETILFNTRHWARGSITAGEFTELLPEHKSLQ